MRTPTTASAALPDRAVDYLVIGAGATGMAFCDTLLHHSPSASSVSVVMVDDHPRPGGQWNDSYDFVRLHQPSDMYGVETVKLEPDGDDAHHHLATRDEILDYYDGVCRTLEEKYDFCFVGDTSVDTTQLDLLDIDIASAATVATTTTTSGKEDEREIEEAHIRYDLSGGRSIRARKVVDARYLQPDLPLRVPPKFRYNHDAINCVPVNSLASCRTKHYVIVGAGKTGMDAITHLLEHRGVDPDDILWVVPNEAWITARENIGSCMEFLHECTSALEKEEKCGEDNDIGATRGFFQRGFLEWEKQGKVYRFDKDILPTKFKDATLCKSELALIKSVKGVVRNGRLESIDDDGTLHFVDGTLMPLPWSSSVKDTTFVHCSAGAFNYSKQTKNPPPIFSRHRISIQDVYGTPGFCFVGSMIGKLESLGKRFTDEEKIAMCSAPSPDPTQAKLPLGPSGGDIGVISTDHGYVQRLRNLKRWLKVPEMRDWLVGHRLFNLRHCTAEEMDSLVEETWNALEKYDVVWTK